MISDRPLFVAEPRAIQRGRVGVLTRRNVIIMLMSIELILNAVNINLVVFSRL